MNCKETFSHASIKPNTSSAAQTTWKTGFCTWPTAQHARDRVHDNFRPGSRYEFDDAQNQTDRGFEYWHCTRVTSTNQRHCWSSGLKQANRMKAVRALSAFRNASAANLLHRTSILQLPIAGGKVAYFGASNQHPVDEHPLASRQSQYSCACACATLKCPGDTPVGC